jgi:hypothetical protein
MRGEKIRHLCLGMHSRVAMTDQHHLTPIKTQVAHRFILTSQQEGIIVVTQY